MFDGKAFGREVVDLTKSFVERSLAPILRRLDLLEAAPKPLTIDDVKLMVVDAFNDPKVIALCRVFAPTVTPDLKAAITDAANDMLDQLRSEATRSSSAFTTLVREEQDAVAEAIASIPAEIAKQIKVAMEALPKLPTAEEVAALVTVPKDGKNADPEEIRAIVAAEVAALPPAKNGDDGKSVTLDDVRPLIEEVTQRLVDALPKPKDGADADPEMVKAEVAKAVAALPPAEKGEPGKSVTLDDVQPNIEEAVRKEIAKLPAAKDGVGLAGALIDQDGHLVVTLTDGTVCKLGRVDGEPGAPGADGVGFDDIDVAHDGGRGFTVRFVRGDRTKEFTFVLPVVLDRGVFKDGTAYAAGDGVTFGGSFWIAQRETSAKPGTDDSWRLSVKKGRDGKDGEAPKPPTPVKL